ncbi:putative methyltransferase-domain-containing protein [Mycena floridula]|nr:putative methyltransferase-domain-containing protein [Mycena floridula]
MYSYLSFLRPPPTQVSQSLTITPLIGNDLRTEVFEGTVELWAEWLTGPHLSSSGRFKLTTWHGISSMYKEVSVPLPRLDKKGDSTWVLGLSASAQGTKTSDGLEIPLGARKGELVPFPVLSVPILFPVAKQESIQRLYRVPQRGNLRIVERVGFDLDKKIWDAGIGLSSWLVALASIPQEDTMLASLKSLLFGGTSLKLVELGAGTGIVSLTLALLGVAGTIFTTDLPSAMPLLENNIAINEHLFVAPSSHLDWDDPTAFQGGDGWDLILQVPSSLLNMADVTYNTASFDALVKTILGLLSPSTRILLGYKVRDPSERELWNMLKDRGVGQVEVWVT